MAVRIPKKALALGGILVLLSALHLAASKGTGVVAAPPVPEGEPAASSCTVPLYFETNTGQEDAAVKFIGRGAGYTVFLTQTETVVTLTKPDQEIPLTREPGQAVPDITYSSAVVRLGFAGGNPAAPLTAADPLPGKLHMFRGSDPAGWRTNIPACGRVTCEGVYPGVDVEFYAKGALLEFDFIVAPGTDPSCLKLDVTGSDQTSLDEDGNLVLETTVGDLKLLAPESYQDVGGIRVTVDSNYEILPSGEVGFQFGAYDNTLPLVVDPVLRYSSLLPFWANDVAVDPQGSAYVCGRSVGVAYTPIGGTPGTPGDDIAVVKLNPEGDAFDYAVLIGGEAQDWANAIAVDDEGHAYLTGRAGKGVPLGFPATTGAYQTTVEGPRDAFVVKVSPDGTSLVYSTLFGGPGPNGFEEGWAIAIDDTGHAHIGVESNVAIPVVPAGAVDEAGDTYLVKFEPDGSAVEYITRHGAELVKGLDVNASGEAYMVGWIEGQTMATAGSPFQSTHGGGFVDGYLLKVSSDGLSRPLATYFGGSADDWVDDVVVDDGDGSIYVTGPTQSGDLYPGQPAPAPASYDAFVARFDSTATNLVDIHLIAGSSVDQPEAIALTTNGTVVVTGHTQSTNLPVINEVQATKGAGTGQDVFVAELSLDPVSVEYLTYLGGGGSDLGYGVAVDPAGSAYVAGRSLSPDFPVTPGAIPFEGSVQGFVSKIAKVSLSVTDVNGLARSGYVKLGPTGGESNSISASLTEFGAVASVVFTATATGTGVTAPAVPVITTPQTPTPPANPDVFTVSEPTIAGTGTAGVQIYLVIDELPHGLATGNTNWSLQVGPLDEGSHNVVAYAVVTDPVHGDITSEPSAAVPFSINYIPPVAPQITTDSRKTNDDTPVIDGTATPNITVEVLVNGTFDGSTTADGTGLWNYHNLGATKVDGVYLYSARAVNTSGRSLGSNSIAVTVDTFVAPASTVTLTPQAGAIDIHWTPSPDGDVLGYRVYRSDDGGPYSLVHAGDKVVVGNMFRDLGASDDQVDYSYKVVAVDNTKDEDH